jgi:hypothetical protein
MLAAFERFVGHPVDLDARVYRSEVETGHRNCAIVYLELNAGMIDGNVEEHLDLYFMQCSILVTARDLAVKAATLAKVGIMLEEVVGCEATADLDMTPEAAEDTLLQRLEGVEVVGDVELDSPTSTCWPASTRPIYACIAPTSHEGIAAPAG